MTIEEYQKLAARTLKKDTFDKMLANAAMGLCGESGECCDIVKKYLFQGHELNREKLKEELGDVAWYFVAFAAILDIPISDIFEGNIKKLQQRYQGKGFSAQESVNRPEYVLTRQDLIEYSATHPSVSSMLHNAMIKIENGVCFLEYPNELTMHAAIIRSRIDDISNWVNKRKTQPVMIDVRVVG